MTRPASAKPSVRVALIGFGYWGPNYARVLHELPQVDLKVICDRSADRLNLVRQRYRTVGTCATVEEVFARDDVDAMVIATPASTHASLVRAALERDLHVLVEKPMALDTEGGAALCRLAESSGRVLMVGYTFLYNGGVRKMKECMRPDQFGRPYYLHATRTNLGPIRQDVNAVGTWRRTTSRSSISCSMNSRCGRRRSARGCCGPLATTSPSPRWATAATWWAIST